ncbi:MAG: lysine--tRNA ligase, partial [Clostridiales bacterium]|nr:lysine--tRNA ligase [Clostridiales bacterium]
MSEFLKVRREKLAELRENGKDPFQITTYHVDAYAKDINDKFDEYEGKMVSIAGRIMSKRGMGKAGFIDVADHSGRVQSYVRKDHVGDEAYADFKKYDIGDIIGIKGEVFRTQKGQISVKAEEILLLSKSLRPLPEKWHGLKDQDTRYRQRYVDLIVNPEVKETFIKRSRIITEIRKFLDGLNFVEVETPVLHTVAGGASARPFITHHNAQNMEMYMRIALELHLKRLIVGGFDRVYELGRVFRNEGMDTRHNPVFTLLELYQAYTDFHGMMDITENMIRTVAQNVLGTTTIQYGEHTLDLGKPFERITMADSVKKYSGVDFSEIKTVEDARAVAKEHHIEY